MRIAAGLLSLSGVAYSFTVPISQQQSPLLHHHSHRSTTTTLGYLAGNDDDVVPHHSPMPEEKKKKTRQQQRPRRPIRRSFLHKLDRLLTELQGEKSCCALLFMICHMAYHLQLFLHHGGVSILLLAIGIGIHNIPRNTRSSTQTWWEEVVLAFVYVTWHIVYNYSYMWIFTS